MGFAHRVKLSGTGQATHSPCNQDKHLIRPNLRDVMYQHVIAFVTIYVSKPDVLAIIWQRHLNRLWIFIKQRVPRHACKNFQPMRCRPDQQVIASVPGHITNQAWRVKGALVRRTALIAFATSVPLAP